MKSNPPDYLALLEKVKRKNDENVKTAAKLMQVDEATLSKQQLFAPETEAPTLVPTLDPDFSRPITPMLAARFKFASRWENGTYGHDWLSVAEMRELWTARDKMGAVDVRKEYWDDSPPATCPWNRLSLFAVDYLGGEEIYLLWPDELEEEPSVVAYFLDTPHEFPDLSKMWEFYVAEQV
ncbi:hypothetical protein [Roseimicrobium sp. ORNL1]|uniref:hypothetical protein n=1 Tax=Roseimicrobium sp. ORNL1 TaxID=2711231 RepID=UPI0013E14F4C|nr:hypothetical protein [Roseimicrobium sp. ORNL1]QIF02153.1 hypothetical protein G5S37_11625 [Roseimicrobium sp. ORNL1]